MTHRSHTYLYILSICISSLLLLKPLPMQAQDAVPTAPLKGDTTAFFRGFSVMTDLVGPAQLAFGDYGQWEVGARLNIKDKYFPIFELGIGKADADDPATHLTYKTSAPYGRIGVDFNLMRNKHDDYRLYGGLRYAYTKYQFDLFCPGVDDPVWRESADFRADDVDCYYHWLEFAFGIDAKIWGPVRMGWSARYKRRLFHDDGFVGRSWYVPGYGKQGNARLGGTFNVIIEF